MSMAAFTHKGGHHAQTRKGEPMASLPVPLFARSRSTYSRDRAWLAGPNTGVGAGGRKRAAALVITTPPGCTRPLSRVVRGNAASPSARGRRPLVEGTSLGGAYPRRLARTVVPVKPASQ